MKVLICYSGYLGTTKKIAYYIEEKLKDYLYDFPYEINNDVKETVEFE